MFATIKSLIPEPRQADEPRHYVGRHRRAEPAQLPVSPAPVDANPTDEPTPQQDNAPRPEIAETAGNSAAA